MAKSICIVCPDTWDIQTFMARNALVLGMKNVSVQTQNSLQFIDEELGAYIDLMLMPDQLDVKDDYLDDESNVEHFRNDLDCKLFYLISFNSLPVLKKMLNEGLSDFLYYNCWVDDDNGKVMTVSEFLLE